jgi:hypothetical protein
MRFSSFDLLSSDPQAVTFFDANRHNTDSMPFRLDLIEGSETVVWPEPKFPLRAERHWSL